MDEIKVTVGELVDVEMSGALNRLSALRLAVKPAYHVHKLVSLVRSELKTYEARRLKLVEEHGTKRDATPMERQQGAKSTVTEVLPGTEAFEAFQADIEE